MNEQRDPDLEQMFRAAARPLDEAAFARRIVAEIAREKHARRWVRYLAIVAVLLTIAPIIAVCLPPIAATARETLAGFGVGDLQQEQTSIAILLGAFAFGFVGIRHWLLNDGAD